MLCAIVFSIALSKAEPINSFSNSSGLIVNLVEYKMTGEDKLLRVLSDSSYSDGLKKKGIVIYGELRLLVDKLVMQLVFQAEMKNSIKLMRKLDKRLRTFSMKPIERKCCDSRNLRVLIDLTEAIEKKHQELIDLRPDGERGRNKTLFWGDASYEQITGFLGLVTQTMKEVREHRGKKVDAMSEMLNEWRLSSISDLLKPTEPEESEEEGK